MCGTPSLPKTVPKESDPDIQRIVRYWQSIHCDGELPDRSQIDPCAFMALLPGIALIEVEHSPVRFKFCLIGDEMNTYHGSNYTGCWLDDAFEHFQQTRTLTDFMFTIEQRLPHYRLGRPLLTREKSYIEMERVFLPFRDGGDSVDLLMAFTIIR